MITEYQVILTLNCEQDPETGEYYGFRASIGDSWLGNDMEDIDIYVDGKLRELLDAKAEKFCQNRFRYGFNEDFMP